MNKRISKKPIQFRPYFKQVIWGGDKICAYKGVDQPFGNIGESWEISAMPECESVVSGGDYDGMLLSELVAAFGEQLLGSHVIEKYGRKFPLLLKLIDAEENVSVQVHPGDSLAGRRHNSMGKTELWYIIEADEGSKIANGLNRELSHEEFVGMVADGSFGNVLAVHESRAGDVFFVPAGRVHAIGKGNLIFEIQESSDITYRIFDYNRTDTNGNRRELHTDLAREAMDMKVYDDYKFVPAEEEEALIGCCEHFTVSRLKTEGTRSLQLGPESFTVLMCVKGNLRLSTPEGETYLRQGMTVLLPAAAGECTINGKGLILKVRVV